MLCGASIEYQANDIGRCLTSRAACVNHAHDLNQSSSEESSKDFQWIMTMLAALGRSRVGRALGVFSVRSAIALSAWPEIHNLPWQPVVPTCLVTSILSNPSWVLTKR
jgi:hypothetical protein